MPTAPKLSATLPSGAPRALQEEPLAHGPLPAPGDFVLGGKYRLAEIIGVGGMGVVMAAEHVALRKPVAFKFLAPGKGANVARFVREARAAARIDSEHVVRVDDVGVLEGGAVYMVIERLYGEDVGLYMQRVGPLPIAEAVLYIVQACDAVASAHAAGVIHRDLKPSNLFLAQRPDHTCTIKVLDFGISKLLGTESGDQVSLTRSGAMLGSPRYMPPEQIRNTKTVDERADLWSLGMVLYELLVGAAMYDAVTFPALCMAVVNDPAVPLRARRSDAPEGLEAVLLRCAQKDANLRFSSALELALALAPFGPPEAARITARMARRAPSGVTPTLTWTAPPTLPPVGPGGADSGARPTLPSWRCSPRQSLNYLTLFVAATLSVVFVGLIVWRTSCRPPLHGVAASGGQAAPAATAPPVVSYEDLPRAPPAAPARCALSSTGSVPGAPATPPASGAGGAQATPVSSTPAVKRHRTTPRPVNQLDLP